MTDLRVRVFTDLFRPRAPLRWAGWALLGAATVLLPWMVVLGISLPATESARHWAIAWMGLDVMETTALAVTGWLVLRRDVRVVMAASAASAFLLADAWFDITTAQPTWDVLQATMLAVFVELPLVVLCATVAVTASRWCDVADRPD
jgi:hypothetical protein